MANIIQDGSYVLAADTEELKGFEQEIESAHLVGVITSKGENIPMVP